MTYTLRFSVYCSVFILLFCWACSSDVDDSVDPGLLTFPCVSWCNTVAPWPHDGNPHQSEHYTVYSDGASLQARMDLAAIAEDVMTDLQLLLEVDSGHFVFPEGQTKIHIYAYRNRYPTEWGGQAWWGGFMIFSMDHPQQSELGNTRPDSYARLVKHELTHVIQNLLVGSRHSFSVHTWFEEGLAEFVSELNPNLRINSLADFNRLVSRFGLLNPIAIHNDILPDIENVGKEYFYPMFELTMRYMLDENGLDQEPTDILNVFLDMRDGDSFEDAFERHFSLSTTTLEAEYFERMRAYLAGPALAPKHMGQGKVARLKARFSSAVWRD